MKSARLRSMPRVVAFTFLLYFLGALFGSPTLSPTLGDETRAGRPTSEISSILELAPVPLERDPERHHLHRSPVVVSDENGFWLIWVRSLQVPSGDKAITRIMARRFSGQGTATGDSVAINLPENRRCDQPSAARLPSGDLVLVWEVQLEGGRWAIHGRRMSPVGVLRAAPFLVSPPWAAQATRPAVAALANGGFVVVWQSLAEDGSGSGVFGRVFGPEGRPTSEPFPLAEESLHDQSAPRVVGTKGGFLAVWSGFGPGGADRDDVWMRSFDLQGASPSPEHSLGDSREGVQAEPWIGRKDANSVITVWRSRGRVMGRFWSRDGLPGSEPWEVGGEEGRDRRSPWVVGSGDGAPLLVLWDQQRSSQESPRGISAQWVQWSTGTPLTRPFWLSPERSGFCRRSQGAVMAGGQVVVAWSSPPEVEFVVANRKTLLPKERQNRPEHRPSEVKEASASSGECKRSCPFRGKSNRTGLHPLCSRCRK